MRFVGDYDAIVLKYHTRLERNARLIFDAAVVVNFLLRNERCVGRHRLTVFMRDLTKGDPCAPLFARNRRKSRLQKFKNRSPRTRREHNEARAYAMLARTNIRHEKLDR
jgi:hypothetical protein